MRSQFHIRGLTLFLIFISVILIYYIRQTYVTEPFISLQELMRRNAMIQVNSNVQGAYNKVIGFMYKYPDNSHGAFKAIGTYFTNDCKYNINWNKVLPPGKSKPLSPQTTREANDAFRTWIQCMNQKNGVCIQQLNDFNDRFLQKCKLKNDAFKSPKNFGNVF